MGKLGAVAHYSARGDRNAHVAMEDPLENRGYALWLSCQGKIRTSKATLTRGPADRGVGDVDGYEIEVNLKRKCFDLWPGLNQMDRASQDAFTSEIYAYLRASGNAICTRKPGLGEHGIPLWWLRKDWNDVKAIGIFKQTELTSREKRLTAAEAGEDRAPAPVTVKQREDAAAAKEAASPTLTASRSEQIVGVLKAATQPLYQREIAEAVKVTSLTAGRLLRELQEAGKVYRRQETTAERPENASGRYRFVYWHAKKIPARKTPLEIGNQTMERVWAMTAGETLATGWMSPGNQSQVRELVEQGLLEYINPGTPEERIRLAPATPSLEESTEETVPNATEEILAEGQLETFEPKPEEEAPAPVSGLTDIAEAIEALVRQRVIERMQVLNEKMARDTELVAEYQQRAQRAESALIEARAELSEAAHERDEAKGRLDAIRSQLGL